MRSTAEPLKILHNHHQIIQYFTPHKKSQWLTRLHGPFEQVHLVEWWASGSCRSSTISGPMESESQLW